MQKIRIVGKEKSPYVAQHDGQGRNSPDQIQMDRRSLRKMKFLHGLESRVPFSEPSGIALALGGLGWPSMRLGICGDLELPPILRRLELSLQRGGVSGSDGWPRKI